MQPKPDVIFANATLTLSAQVAHLDTGLPAKDLTATLIVAGPNEFSKRTEMRADGSYLLGVTSLPARGVYSFRILLKEANGTTYSADTEFEAYPNLPVRIQPVDANADSFVGEPVTLAFRVVNATSLRPADGHEDLRIRMEHWSDDHSQMLGSEEAALTKTPEGQWRLEHTFKKQGMYHLKFASQAGGFTYDDVPILHTYASNPIADEGEDQGERKVPSTGPLALAGLAALAALLARRRLA